MFGDLLAASHPTRRIQQPGDPQLGNRINEPRPADPLWRDVAADHLQLHVVGRARLHWPRSFEDSHEVNLYAFSRFLQNPDASVDAVLRDWAAKRIRSAT